MKRIWLFVFALMPFFSKGQIVSGRVGVFRDSIYLNGVWYNKLVGDSNSYTFNNLIIDSNFAVTSADYRDDSYQYSSPFTVTMYQTNYSIQKYNPTTVDTFILPYPVQVSNGKKYKIVFELCAAGASFVISFPSSSYSYYGVNCSACTQPQPGIIKLTAPYSGFSGYVTIDIFQGWKFVLNLHIGGIGGSGVTGAVPYFSSSSTISSSNIKFDGNSRVSINSSSFDSTFLLSGSAHITGNSLFGGKLNVNSKVKFSVGGDLGGVFTYGNGKLSVNGDNSGDSVLVVQGSIHAKAAGMSPNSGYLAVDRDANVYGNIYLTNNLNLSSGRVYVRIGNSVLTNNNAAADVNMQGAIAASTFAVNTDSLVLRHLYTIQGTQSTPTVLYVYNSSGVNDTINLPPINYTFNLGQNISAYLGSSYDVMICNFTPSAVTQQVIVFPNPADTGATINGSSSFVLPAGTVKRFRGWAIGGNNIWLAY